MAPTVYQASECVLESGKALIMATAITATRLAAQGMHPISTSTPFPVGKAIQHPLSSHDVAGGPRA